MRRQSRGCVKCPRRGSGTLLRYLSGIHRKRFTNARSRKIVSSHEPTDIGDVHSIVMNSR